MEERLFFFDTNTLKNHWKCLGYLFTENNSTFDKNDDGCITAVAPPDSRVKQINLPPNIPTRNFPCFLVRWTTSKPYKSKTG